MVVVVGCGCICQSLHHHRHQLLLQFQCGFGFHSQKHHQLRHKHSKESSSFIIPIGIRIGVSNRKLVDSIFISKAAGLSSFFSEIGSDSPQIFQPQDLSGLSWVGPVPGDIAEVEAYCRIFRAAEQLHIALMDALCNPMTGECSVSYDDDSESEEDLPLLEERVVAVLGCMVALLNKGRANVLSGRSDSFRVEDVNISDDKLPPLTIFRTEMKGCCDSLQIALKSYLRTPSDTRSGNIWRKLHMLKNVCYDAGFPRGFDCPCPTLFANWAPVGLYPTREGQVSKNSEVSFWRGGQVIDEGLKWLIDKGYKTIVDLRAEVVENEFYQEALESAVSSGKIEVVRLPVEVGTAPSMEQVERFASLVSDSDKKPLYLHSQEGVWRTSAMVSRWRQHVARSGSVSVPKQTTRLSQFSALDEKIEANVQTPLLLKNENGSLVEELELTNSSTGVSVQEAEQKGNGSHHTSTIGSPQDTVSLQKGGITDMVSRPKIYADIDPLKAQVPACDIFSKSEMSGFLRNKKVSPQVFFNYRRKMMEESLISRKIGGVTVQKNEILSDAPTSVQIEAEGSDEVISEEGVSSKFNNSSLNGTYQSGESHVSFSVGSKNYDETDRYIKIKSQSSSHNGRTVREDLKSNDKVLIAPNDNGLELGEGDMCASATGVVRVQSRKKAEMYLVRTDGYSCVRENVTESSLAFTHPSTQQQMLMWKSPPKTVLLLKKLGNELLEEAKEVASFLYYQEKMNVLVEPDVHDVFARIPGFGFIQTFYSQDTSDLHERVDFVACLGGDGVILHASNLFRGAVPPVVSFNLGSLGFLTSHTFEDFRQDLRQVIYGNNTLDGVYITLRMRLRCEIFRKGKAMPGKVFDVLNEVVVDRGSNPYLSKIECYEHHRLITKVQGDGVIIATPTGSTAYSTAAGGSMVHPNVPCMLFTPICPHSLSFRPVILPDSAQLELKIPSDTRSNAWVSFDGKRRQQLSRGDSVRISMSKHPLPTVNKSDQTCDWFHSLIRCLNWNERLDQKAL